MSVSVNPGKYVCVFAMSLYACFAEREEERSFTSLKKYGLSNTLGFRKPAALFLPFSVSWVSRRWGRGTGNGPARKPCRVMPFPAFVSWYGHCCVTSVWLCFLPSQINSFYTVSARWYSGLCSFPSQITVFTLCLPGGTQFQLSHSAFCLFGLSCESSLPLPLVILPISVPLNLG